MSLHEESRPEVPSADRSVALSGAQEGLWYAGRLAPDSAAYNTAEAVEIHGALDTALFERALRQAVAEAGTFGLRFFETDDGPRCRPAHDAGDWPLHRADLRGAADPESAAWELIRADLATPVDTDKGPLFAHTLLTLADDRHIWLLRAHHILLDGYSYKLLGRRLADLHNALAEGREPGPGTFEPAGRLREEEAAYLASEHRERDRDHWARHLAGLPEPARLTRRTAAARAPFLRRTAELAAPDAEALSAAANRAGVTRTDLLTAALAVYLHRMTGADDLVLGMATMSRLGGAALRTPGTASDVLPLRVSAQPATPLAEFARSVAGELAALRRHQRYRGESIRRDLGLLGTGRRLYGPVLNIVPFTEELDFAGSAARWHHLSGGAVDDLQVSVRPGTRPGTLWLALDANPALYEEDELALHRDRFVLLLRRLAEAGPTATLADLDLLLPGEHPGDAPVRELPAAATLTELFERQAHARPDRIAVTHGGGHLTYGRLNEDANRAARLLLEHGAGPGRVVALALPRGPRLLPTLLAVLKTGAAYLPLDPGHPVQRLRQVMADAAPVLLVTEAALAGQLAGDTPTLDLRSDDTRTLLLDGTPTLVLDDPGTAAALAGRPAADLTDTDRGGPTGPADTAYIIHTSGSTGRPKGVPVPHAAVVRLFAATAHHFEFDADDVWTLFHSYAFDFSVWEIWGALLHGGRLVVVPYAVSRSPRDFLRLLHEEGVTVLSQTPSAFGQLVDADAESADADGRPTAGALRYVVLGGEALRPELLRPWTARHGLDRPALVNMYGITETTVHVTHHRLTPADLTDPRRADVIGTPLADLRVHLLDADRRPVPPGAVGEMYIAGGGVAPGYLNRPELTAERFLDDPYGPPGGRMYRSGDLARRRADGTLDYLGRADQQIQLRGFRIEPGEIEAVLARHPGVARAAVVVREAGGARQLIAYTVATGEQPPTAAELRSHAAAHLPEHMVPAACVPVDALPLTANGKLDTDALPAPDFGEEAAGGRPANAEQALVCHLFETVLKLPPDTVGVDADFFALGGDSLLATRLLAALRHESGTDVPITALFTAPTPAALAGLLDGRPGTAPARPALGSLPRPGRLPLSYAQERMWVLNRLDGATATYNIPLVVPLGAETDDAALRAALGDLTDRHESLRTVIATADDGTPHQRILPPGEAHPSLRAVDCPAEEIGAHVRAASRHHFDLTAETPLRAWLFGTGEQRVLLLVLHHSAADGWSLRPLADDLGTAYAARRAGTAPAWEALPAQYADHALWQRALLTPGPEGGGEAERLTAHWREALAGAPEECTLPGDRPRPAAPRDGAHVTERVDPGLHRDLTGLAEREGASLFMVLHAAVAALLARCGAGEDIVLGVPVAGRSEPGLDDLIGLVANTLVLRADTSGDPAFRELLARVRRDDLAALDHRELPFDRLVDELNPDRVPGRHPLFQVMLALQNNEPAVLRLDGRAFPLRPTATGTAKVDLFVDVLERHAPDGTPDGLDLHIEYATDLYDPATAAEFARALARLLAAVSADPDTSLGRLPAPPPRAAAEDRTPDIDGLAEAARSVPGVRDAVALPAADGGAPRLFVVPGRANAAESVERLLGHTGPGSGPGTGPGGGTGIGIGTDPIAGTTTSTGPATAAARLTAVNALPRTPDGSLDTAALDALPVVDRTAAADWRDRLTRVAGVAAAESAVEDIPEEPVRRHVGAPRRAQETAPPTTGPAAAERPPALSEGPELTEPSVSSWAEALLRAAERGLGDIVHVRGDGGETRRDYASLVPEASRVLAGLRRAGLRPGDQVILQCDDSEDFLAVLWGCVLGGFTAVPLTVPASYDNPSAALTKLEGIWRMLGRPRVVCSPALEAGLRGAAVRRNWDGLSLTTAAALRDAPEDRDWYAAAPDDIILMLMTSGSTGLPKAVRLTHRNVLTRSAATETLNGLGADDVTLNWIPLDHVTGVVMFHLRDVYLGCRQIHAPTSWILQDPTRWTELAHRHRVTVTWAPNFAFGLLAEQADRFRDRDWDLSPMRLVMNAGEVVAASSARAFLHTLRPFGLPQDVMHPGWGMSETCSVVTDAVLPAEPPGTDETFVSCGLPYPGFAMRVVGEDSAVLSEGDVGRLQVRGTSVTGGYHDNPAANAEAFTEDGWFDTGDLAFLRHGELFITGRAKDVIIVNGVNHYSHEIEACVEELPTVVRSFTAACAVRTDPAAGTDELALFVHLAPGTDPAAALRGIAGKVTREIGVSPAFLVPVGPGDIPKTEIGKIQRTKLRKSFEAGAFDAAVRESQLLLGTDATLPDWFLRPEWRPVAPHPPRALPPGRHTLVLAGADPRVHETADRLARSLRADGDRCTVVTDGPAYTRHDAARYRIRPAEDADHTALLRDLDADGRPVDAVVHLTAPYDGDPARSDGDPARSDGEPALDDGEPAPDDASARTLLALGRALGARPAHLLHVTVAAQAVLDGELPSPAEAMAGAVLKSLREEAPGLACVHLDLDRDADPVPLVRAEAAQPPVDVEVAHRDGRRFARRLAALPETPHRVRPPAGEGFHLISGGLGGVGTELAAHLMRTPGTRLLLLGRGAPGDHRLPDSPDVRYARADVTDEEQVRDAVDAAAKDWGVPLVSVWHLAGALVERPAGELDAHTWRSALAAKVRGAWTLHRIAADHPVTSFVLFSSVNGWFGGALNTAYAAANAGLDALAVHRRARGLPAQSLAWSMWHERGMSEGYRLAALTEARGYRVLDIPAALRSLDFARTLDEPHLLIGADRTAPWVRSHVAEPVRGVRRLAGRVTLEDGADIATLHRAATDAASAAPWVLSAVGSAQQPAANGAEERLHALEQRLAALWCEVLGRDRVGRDDNFFDLGGNSLRLVTAHTVVNRAFGTDLTVVDLFAHPTVRDLARHLAARTPAPDGASDEDGAGEPPPPSGLDRAREQARRQREARARRSPRNGKGRGHA
ncbi:amino acid adenylation domain-containing protein [Streptomyces sp. NPDC058867]|uniref:amino acid adenylation domain-containing protein n=1 Tax=unclassified Streptomyces TaxID=2593676 RepID=UPI00368957A5